MMELPSLDRSRCRGAADCVLVCPVGCLELVADAPWLARPSDCLSCALCVVICPNDALSMAPVPEEE